MSDNKFIKSNIENSEVIAFIFDELETMTTNLVVKLDYRARKGETTNSRQNGTIYIEAVTQMDVFEAHPYYEPDIIRDIKLGVGEVLSTGVTVTQEMFNGYCNNPYTIPFEYRKLALAEKRKYIIEKYVEPNPYYRELHGEPPLNCRKDELVYLKYKTDATDNEDLETTPVHLFSRDTLIKMELSGELADVINENETKRYLRHLLDLKIPYYVARKASNFELLYLSKPKQHEVLADRFVAIYNKTCTYAKEVIYDPSFKNIDNYYDSFIGIFILTISIQRFIVNYIKSGIKREFFNKSIIKMYLDSYGIPFYGDISLTYLTRIAKNLNILLLFKSTDQIFTDIFELFGMKDSQIYKYFLLKDRKTDAYGVPVFATKEIINEFGEKETVDDVQAMYDLKFVSIPADTKQLSVDILDRSKYVDYSMVVDDDVLWGGDGDREAFEYEVLKAEFNYIETKYISMTSKYELSKLGFEMCYFFRLIQDLKDEQNTLRIVTPLGSHDLFDVFVAMFGLASVQLNFDGNIMDTDTKVLSILGFNFDRDDAYIQSIIEDINIQNPDILIVDGRPQTFKDKGEMLNFYFKNRDTYKSILTHRRKAKTIKEYNAYTKLYRATMVTKYSNKMYTKKDGTIAKTYVDYLEDTDVNLYKMLKETNKENVVDNLDNILVWLDEYFKSDKFDNIFLNIPTLSLDSIKRFIFYLIDIFKSYTVDLLSMNIIYNMGDKDTEVIRLLDEWTPIVDMEQNGGHIKIWDQNAYTTPVESMLESYIKIREEVERADSFERIDNIKIVDESLIDTTFDRLGDNGNDSHYTYDTKDVSKEKHLNDSIRIRDFIFIEEQ